MNTRIIAAIAAALLGVAGSGIARAQVIPYVDTACGVWNGDVWTPNGHCGMVPKGDAMKVRVAR